jgi:hypothetical protein
MSMQAASLEVLERANLPAPQARAIVQAIEIELGAAHSTLAARQDLELHQQATKQQLEMHEQATKRDLELHRQEIKQQLEMHEQATKQQLERHEHATKQQLDLVRRDFEMLRQDFEMFRQTMKHDLEKSAADLRIEIQASARDTAWRFAGIFVGVIVAQTGVLLGFCYFALLHLKA